MAKKRSKQDKLKAQQLRQARSQKKSSINVVKLSQEKDKEQKSPQTAKDELKNTKTSFNRQLFAYDPKFILFDLRKTLVVTIIILLVLAFLALRYT